MNREPDIQLGGLLIRVLGRQFPDHNDYWDGNWFNIHARVEAPGATVEVDGPIIHAGELARFADELEKLNSTVSGTASLDCIEAYLRVSIRGERTGQATVSVSITPEHMSQSHTFKFAIDQTYYGPLLASCRRILASYPLRGVDS